MPRVFTAKAGKDYPNAGIQKGQLYYYWSFFRGPKQMSKTPPRQSQLTQTKMSDAYAAMETLEDAVGAEGVTPEDIASALGDAAEAIRGVAEEYRDSASEMEQYFQGGSPTIDDHNEKADNLDALADELDSAQSDVEALDASDYAEDETKNPEGGEHTFDTLNDEEKAAMIEAAREAAGGPSIDF